MTLHAPSVIAELEKKHPENAPPSPEILDKLKNVHLPKVEPIIFEGIDEASREKAAKTTKGSAGPSGMDSDMWRRILCSKAYGSASE